MANQTPPGSIKLVAANILGKFNSLIVHGVVHMRPDLIRGKQRQGNKRTESEPSHAFGSGRMVAVANAANTQGIKAKNVERAADQ